VEYFPVPGHLPWAVTNPSSKEGQGVRFLSLMIREPEASEKQPTEWRTA